MATLAGAIIAALVAYRGYVRQRGHQQDVLLNALFGELANLYEHYWYVGAELPAVGTPSSQMQRRFQMSRYGTFRSLDDLTLFGFLTANDVRLLLQLSLRVRNNDLLFESLLAHLESITQSDLEYATARVAFTLRTLESLMGRLVEGRPALGEILDAIRRDVPALKRPFAD